MRSSRWKVILITLAVVTVIAVGMMIMAGTMLGVPRPLEDGDELRVVTMDTFNAVVEPDVPVEPGADALFRRRYPSGETRVRYQYFSGGEFELSSSLSTTKAYRDASAEFLVATNLPLLLLTADHYVTTDATDVVLHGDQVYAQWIDVDGRHRGVHVVLRRGKQTFELLVYGCELSPEQMHTLLDPVLERLE